MELSNIEMVIVGILCFFVGSFAGMFIAGLLRAARDDDDK